MGNYYTSWSGGIPQNTNLFRLNPILSNLEVSEYAAPAFEIMLFYEASKLSIELGLKIPDAIHVLCSRGNADILVTNDRDLLKYRKKPDKVGIHIMDIQEALQEC